ncbi:hypothetical protein [Aliamphritea hakodatensis]|uniref:hypothetical protein n=1 Tax=Aliamphritea hakodatensis TaxID=2895352 RepID=UPI0022FDACBE|nr:hypothetical protein [Aliamphritea hakodatensis]
MKFINNILLVLIVSVIAGCDNRSTDEKFPPLSKYYPPTEDYPQGYADVQMGDYLLRVPEEIASVGKNGSFSVYMSWPEFEDIKTSGYFRQSSVQRNIDTIEVFFRSFRQGIKAGDPWQQGNRARERKINLIKKLKGQEHKSVEFPSYWEFRNPILNNKPNLYMPMDKNIIDPFGLPVIFGCSTFNLDVEWDEITKVRNGLPQCGRVFHWPDGHSVHIRFKRKHLKDAVLIYQKVMALHNSMIVTSP